MLNCSDRGVGEPVVLLHGIPGSKRTWGEVEPFLLEAGLRVVVPDLLGFGESPDGSEVPHAFEQGRALLETLEHAGLGATHVAGFDFGGPVAVALTILAPQRVRSLTVLATNLLADTPVPWPLQVARIPAVGEAAFRLLFSNPGAKAMWRMATVDREAFPYDAFRETGDARTLRTTRRIFLNSLRQLRELYTSIEEALPNIRVPATVVWGERDPFFPIAVGRRTAKHLEGSTFIVLEGCGHFVPNERPAEVAAAIVDTVRRDFPP